MIIRELEKKDIEELCKIHKNSFDKSHFSAHFTETMLINYYKFLIIYNEHCFGLFEEDAKTPSGYIISGTGYDKTISEFIKVNRMDVILTIVKNPWFLYEKVLDFIYCIFRQKKTELIIFILAVVKNQKGKGIGKKLVAELEDILRKEGRNHYGLYVRKNNSAAINFYERNHFIRSGSNYKNYFYLKHI